MIVIVAVVSLFCWSFARHPKTLEALLPETTKLIATARMNTTQVDTIPEISKFEQAVALIKKYETLHQPKHWPLVGYGHLVLPGEKFSRTRPLSEWEADALLRKDLLKNCALFREFGADSLLLGVLAYNIGSGNARRSPIFAMLKSGNRDIRNRYLAHSYYKGRKHPVLQKRRVEEFDLLFVSNPNMNKNERNSETLSNEEFTAAISTYDTPLPQLSYAQPTAPTKPLTDRLIQ